MIHTLGTVLGNKREIRFYFVAVNGPIETQSMENVVSLAQVQ